MEKFITLKGIAAPLPMINVDTDMIIPKQFLKTIKRSGLGKNLFHELRFDIQGNIKNDFVFSIQSMILRTSAITSLPIPSPGKIRIFLLLILYYPRMR